VLTACATPAARLDRAAERAGLERELIERNGFVHVLYHSRDVSAVQGRSLAVFLDGDGLPWTDGGTKRSSDPTPRNPLALKLVSTTPIPSVYVSRPCYLGRHDDPGCSADLWTSARYGRAVVENLRDVIASYARRFSVSEILLFGYSGGGVLATLLASRLQNCTAVITIAANLDTDAWTAHHGYLPLTGSLNPATEAPLPERVRQIHLVGSRDQSVPFDSVRRFLASQAQALIWRYDDFDHRCCWAERWPEIVDRVLQELQNGRAEASHFRHALVADRGRALAMPFKGRSLPREPLRVADTWRDIRFSAAEAR